jgi:hypothetical protein
VRFEEPRQRSLPSVLRQFLVACRLLVPSVTEIGEDKRLQFGGGKPGRQFRQKAIVVRTVELAENRVLGSYEDRQVIRTKLEVDRPPGVSACMLWARFCM